MSTVSHALLQRILKLQALAQSDNPNESEAAARAARQLQLAHAVTQADLDAAQREREDPILLVECYLDGLTLVPAAEVKRWYGRTMDWKRSLAFAVCSYLGVVGSYSEGSGYFDLHGYLSDTKAVQSLYAVCARQIDRACRVHLREQATYWRDQPGGWYNWDNGKAQTEATNFRASAVAGLRHRFNALKQESLAQVAAARTAAGQEVDAEMQEAVQAEAEAHGMVLSRKANVDAWVEANVSFGKGRTLNEGAEHNHAGYTVGKTLKLHEDGGIEGKSHRALGGA